MKQFTERDDKEIKYYYQEYCSSCNSKDITITKTLSDKTRVYSCNPCGTVFMREQKYEIQYPTVYVKLPKIIFNDNDDW